MPRKITAEDFARVQPVSDPQISPDGVRVVCVKTHVDTKKNSYRNEIWMTPAGGGEPRRFTGDEWSDGGPRWSPDGARIAFVSDRQKPKSQIYTIPTDGGEAQALTTLEEGSLGEMRWSPDGTKIAFLFRATPEAYRKEAVEERKKKEFTSPPRFHTRHFYRLDGVGYFDDSYWQVWVADAQTGESRPLTSGEFHCQGPVWSPDSRLLAFLSNRNEYADVDPTSEDIWTVPVEGGELTRIPSPPGSKSGLAWSPDGTQFAYAGNTDLEDQWGTKNERVFVLPATGNDVACDLTGSSDLAVGYLTLSDTHSVGAGDLIQWAADGKSLYFTVSSFGDTRLAVVPVIGGEVIPLSPEKREMGGFHVRGDRIAVTIGSATAPHELYVRDDSDDFRPLTQFHRAFLEETQTVAPEEVAIPNGEGGEVPGWLLRPPDFDPTRKYPLVLYVHGGPHAQYGAIYFHELQWLAAEGYVILYANPRGSKGYGEAHTTAIKGDWGGADFRDIMAAADYATGLDYVDATRTAIMGGSYGGYMTAWAIGHTDRFRCAVADRLVANLHSMSGTTDFPWQHRVNFKGDAWNDPSDLWRCSPLAYAGRIVTPLLIIHSDGDLRCPVGQAEELFAALRLQKKTVEFVRYSAETSHGLSRNGPPDMRLDRLRRNLTWLDRWLKT